MTTEPLTVYEILQSTDLPCAYSHFRKRQELPYIVYSGSGQNTMAADNTWYYRQNTYQIEYYFKEKDEANETAIEDALLDNGYQYIKSDDVYISDQDCFVIYYNI